MRIATIRQQRGEEAAVVTPRGLAPVRAINHYHGTAWPTRLLGLLEVGLNPLLGELAAGLPADLLLDPGAVTYGPLYRRPRKIWGIGLNYREHADDLGATYPTEPASFMKGDHTIIGPGDTIWLPMQSQRVTAEAELGLIIGRTCYQVSETEVPAYIAGVCLVLDQTAEDILQLNPRFLTRAKNFPGFFSFGPELITLDEAGDLNHLEITTAKNGREHRSNQPVNMTYPLFFLVSFHSQVMPLYPGDIIATGTPGAVVVADGDTAACWIKGLGRLQNPVRRAQ